MDYFSNNILFVIDSADCVDTFAKRSKLHGSSGTRQTGRFSQQDCEKYCLANSRCLAYEWWTTTVECWWYDDADNFVNPTFNSGADLFIREPCLGNPNI